MASESAVSVLIVDEHPIVRYGISQLLEQATDLCVIAETCSCGTAWKSIKTKAPRVLLIDVDLKDGCALRLIAKVTKARLQTRILVYSANAGELQITDALRSGAHGFITKDIQPDELLKAIRTISESGSYLDPAVTSKVIGQLGRKQERRAVNGRRLTQRESAVLQAIALGKRSSDIAAELFISERTVKYHLSSMYNKLQVSNRTQAVKYAFKYGLIK
jgi:DNA-binding NarL/FixJ family response regulator